MRSLRRFIREPEVIGVPECPLLYRWTLLKVGKMPYPNAKSRSSDMGTAHSVCKVMVHHFLPESRDRHTHDHPWSFITVVLHGEYIDESLCGTCRGTDRSCPNCEGSGHVVELMTAGRIRYRNAHHAHKTFTGEGGCWTLVIAGPITRAWGFFLDGKWLPWRTYEEKVGHGMRCE
jgi:hypothetical protein